MFDYYLKWAHCALSCPIACPNSFHLTIFQNADFITYPFSSKSLMYVLLFCASTDALISYFLAKEAPIRKEYPHVPPLNVYFPVSLLSTLLSFLLQQLYSNLKSTHHLTPFKMAVIKKIDLKCWRGGGERELLVVL